MATSRGETPYFSVVIPLFNKGRYVERALRSALAQTEEDFEAIVVDDGSTDDGPQRVRAFDDPRLRMIRQDNAGVSAARNRAIRESRGACVAFLDADDEWMPEHLEVLRCLERIHPAAGILATAYWVEWQDRRRPARLRALPGDPHWDGLLPNYFAAASASADLPVWTTALAIPRRVLDEVGLFAVGVRSGEDQDLWTRIALRYPVAYSRRMTAVYVQQASAAARRYDPAEEELVKRWRSYAGANPPPHFERFIALRQATIVHKCILDGNRSHARDLLARLPGNPWSPRRLLLRLACFLPARYLSTYRGLKRLLSSPAVAE